MEHPFLLLAYALDVLQRNLLTLFLRNFLGAVKNFCLVTDYLSLNLVSAECAETTGTQTTMRSLRCSRWQHQRQWLVRGVCNAHTGSVAVDIILPHMAQNRMLSLVFCVCTTKFQPGTILSMAEPFPLS